MSPLEIIIPLIWAGGLLCLGIIVSRNRVDCRIEYFFPMAGALGLFIYFLGLLNLWHRAIFTAMTIVLLAVFVAVAVKYSLISRCWLYLRRFPIFFSCAAVALIWSGLAALSYPVSTDALYFHLGLPKIYADSGQIFFTPGILFSAGPRTMEMINTGFYFLGLERAAAFFIVLMAAILILSIFLRASEFGGDGRFAVAILITAPIFLGQVVGAKNDFLLWGLAFFAFVKFTQFYNSGRITSLLWLAVGVGLAAGTKAIGLALFGPFAVIIIFNILLGKMKIEHLALFAIVGLVLALPWYIYSLIVTGNPVFPFFDTLFRSHLTTPLNEQFNAALAIKGISPALHNLVLTPIRIIFEPELYDGRLGFAIVLFPMMLILLTRIPQAIKLALGVAVIYYLIWFFGFPFSRFLLPVGPILAIAGSHFILRAELGPRILKVSALASLAMAVLIMLPGIIRDTLPRALSVLKGTPKIEFLRNYQALDPYQTSSGESSSAIPYLDCWQFVNERTPEGSTIGILTSFITRADGYYLDRRFVYLNPSEQVQYDFTSLRNVDQISSTLESLGITHVVIDSNVVQKFQSDSDWSEIPGFEKYATGVNALLAFCNLHGRLIYRDVGYQLFEIISPQSHLNNLDGTIHLRSGSDPVANIVNSVNIASSGNTR